MMYRRYSNLNVRIVLIAFHAAVLASVGAASAQLIPIYPSQPPSMQDIVGVDVGGDGSVKGGGGNGPRSCGGTGECVPNPEYARPEDDCRGNSFNLNPVLNSANESPGGDGPSTGGIMAAPEFPTDVPVGFDMPLGDTFSDPLVSGNGVFTTSATDLYAPHEGSWVSVRRTFLPNAPATPSNPDFGPDFNSNLRITVEESTDMLTATVDLGWGVELDFTRASTSDPFDAPTGFERYNLDRVTTGGGFEYQLIDHNYYTYYFDEETSSGHGPWPLIETQNIHGVGELYLYDGSGYLETIELDSTFQIDISRDATTHRIESITDSAGRAVDYTYDATSGRLLTVTGGCDCGGDAVASVRYVYDGNGRMTEIYNGDDVLVRKISYVGSTDTVDSFEDPFDSQNEWSFTFSSTEVTSNDFAGNVTEYTLDTDGNVTRKVVAAGTSIEATYEYEYDSRNRLTKITNPDDSEIEYTYDDRNRPYKITVLANEETLALVDTTYNTTYGQVTWSKDALGNQTTFAYNSNRELTSITRPDSTVQTFSYTVAGGEYDLKGAPKEIDDATTLDKDITYTKNGTSGKLTKKVVIEGDSATETVTRYNLFGKVEYTKPALGNATELIYDKAGNVTEVTSGGLTTLFGYDANGKIESRTVKQGATTLQSESFDHNKMGWRTSATDAEGLETTYTYDAMGRLETTTDPAGVSTRRTYDARGRVTKIEVGDATPAPGTWTTRQTMTYDTMNRITKVTDGESNDTDFEYDDFGRQTKVIDALGNYTKNTYDDNGRVTKVERYEDPASGPDVLLSRTDTTYNSRGWVTKVRQFADADGLANDTLDAVTETSYDDEGRITKRRQFIGNATYLDTVYTYNAKKQLWKVTDPDSNVTIFTYDAAGRRTKVTDALNRDTVTAYDAEGRVEKVTRPDGSFTTYGYNHRDQQTEVIVYSSDVTPVKLSKTTTTYDDAGRTLEVRRWADPDATTGGSSDHVTTNTYDATSGRLTKTTNASGEDTTYTYDSTYGYRTKGTLPDDSYIEYLSFDGNGRAKRIDRVEKVPGQSDVETRAEYVRDELGRVEKITNQGADGTFGNSDDLDITYEFDPLGRRDKVTAENGQVTETLYNDIGRKTKITEDATGIARMTEFEYDRAGRMTKLIAYTDSPSTGKQETQFYYNGNGQQTEVIYEETGSVTMTYDAVGNMTERIDEAGVRVVYAYDADTDRLTDRRKFGATTDIETFTYDDLGRLKSAQKGTSANPDAVSKSVFVYNDLSRVTQETQYIEEGSGRVVTYQYDAAGNRTQIYAGSGVNLAANLEYDSRDRVSTIKLGTVSRVEYDWVGNAIGERRVEMTEYPGATNPEIATIYTRDGLLRVTEVANELITSDQADTGFNDLGTFTYTYDDASNPLTEAQTGSLTWADADRTFTYDGLNRLKTAAMTDTQNWTAATQVTDTYNYDDLGNRTENIVTREDSDIDYVHDKANRTTQIDGQAQTYDLAGNLTKTAPIYEGNAYRYKYDHHNRLIEVKEDSSGDVVANFTYDALGRRIIFEDVINEETTHYYFDGVNELVETAPDGTARRFYIHGASYVDERVLARDFTTGEDLDYTFTLNRMYDIRGVVDESGNLRERVMNDPYGKPYIRQMPGSGDFNNDGIIDISDTDRMDDVVAATTWDPRGDADFDGDVDATDEAIIDEKANIWNTTAAPVVARAFSTVGNSYLFQGRPQFVFDTLKTDDDTDPGDSFGHTAAVSGDFAVLGTPGEDSVASGAGAAYVYKLNGTQWRIFQKLTNDDGAVLDSFGISVAIDGTRIAVGAPGDDTEASSAGAVFVYELVGNEWIETEVLTASDAAASDTFGRSVAIDGDVLVAGANLWENGTTDSGAVYVFRHDGTDWDEEEILDASDAQASAEFGIAVDVDGDAIVVGAPGHDVSSNSNAGKAYVFRYDSGTTSWSEEDDFPAGDLDASARFGDFVSISGDRVAIGAPLADYDPGFPVVEVSDTGAVYIFDESSGSWSESFKLHASDKAASDAFSSVSLDGDRLLVGAFGETTSTGAAYVFEYDDTGSPVTWDEDQIITASDGGTYNYFGRSVSLDGDRLLVGASTATVGSTTAAGAVYVFDYVSSDWDESEKVSALVPLVPAVATHWLLHHRARFHGGVRWTARDPLGPLEDVTLYHAFGSNPLKFVDPSGNEVNDSGEMSSCNSETHADHRCVVYSWHRFISNVQVRETEFEIINCCNSQSATYPVSLAIETGREVHRTSSYGGEFEGQVGLKGIWHIRGKVSGQRTWGETHTETIHTVLQFSVTLAPRTCKCAFVETTFQESVFDGTGTIYEGYQPVPPGLNVQVPDWDSRVRSTWTDHFYERRIIRSKHGLRDGSCVLRRQLDDTYDWGCSCAGKGFSQPFGEPLP